MAVIPVTRYQRVPTPLSHFRKTSGQHLVRGAARGLILAPEALPLPSLPAEEGAQVADAVGSALAPAHPPALEPLPHHRLARALHRPRPDLPAPPLVLRVVHAVPLVREVAHHLAVPLLRRRRPPAQLQRPQARRLRRSAPRLQPPAPRFA